MLVLSRKVNESIELPELGIVIRVLGQKGAKVQLGIDAPPDIKVMRSEKLEADRPARLASYFRPPDCPSRQFDKDLTRLESQFAALAELADTRDRSLAQEVAADAIDRLAKLKRRTNELPSRNRAVGAASDVVTVRADVIDQLRRPDSADVGANNEFSAESVESRFCVRQSEAEYVVESRRQKSPDMIPNLAPNRRRKCTVA